LLTCASAKETYSGGKRDLLRRQKRPTLEAKETYSGGQRDLHWRQKRPKPEPYLLIVEFFLRGEVAQHQDARCLFRV